MKLKKVLASVMAALMVMSSTVNAFAADPIPTVPEGETTPTEEVVIEEPVVDEPEVDPVKNLFDKLMAFETYEALDAYMTDEMTEEDYVLLGQFSDEQNAALTARIAELQENEVVQLDNRTIYVNWTGVSTGNVTSVTVTYRGGNSSRNVTINNGTSTATLNVGDRGLDGLSVVVNQPDGAEKTYIASIERRGGGFGQTYYEVVLTEYIEGQINHTFDHLDVRIQDVSLTLKHRVINMITGVEIENKDTTIEANVVGVDSVTINGTTYTGFTQRWGYREYTKSNVEITITPESTAVIVVDLVDENGKRYNDVSITYNREGIQYAIEHCDGYSEWNGRPNYSGIDFDPSEGTNNITLIEYDEYVIPVQKVWDDDDNRDGKRPDAVTVVLYANGVQNETATLNEANGWKYNFTEKPSVDASGADIIYTVEEASVPSGYTHTANDVVNNQETGYIDIMNHYVPETTSVTVTKVWNDADNQDGIRPGSVTINLLANDKEVKSADVTADGGWTYTFENLPKYEAGEEIAYSITEEAVEGYESEVNGFTVTNTHEPEETEATVTKVWDDEEDQDGKRPESLTVTLSDGQTVTLNEENQWTATVTDLPKYANGQEIEYTWTEGEVEGYELTDTSVNGTVTTLTNTHVPELIDLTVTKVWDDNFNQDGARPASITIKLLADGEKAATVTLTEKNSNKEGEWVHTFQGYPKYAAGKEIKYTIEEDAVAGYEASYADLTVTNTHEPEVVSVSVNKVWDDAEDQDGIRPVSITIKLLADGTVKSSATVTEEDGWEYSFNNLPKYQNGQEVAYSIEEVNVEGYESEISGSAEEGYTVTNTHEPEVVSVSGSKTWDDANNQDGIRPASITINLLADGDEVGSATVTENNQWTWSFDDLPKFKAGVEIEYTITEDAVAGYESEISGSAEDGFNVTNTHTPETIDIEGSKTWEDANNQDGIRPASITINLLADGEEVDEIEVNAEDEWAWSFTDLPKYEAGVEIEYTITEDEVEGYTTTINGYDVTNTHTPATIDVEGSKTWEDADDQDGIRPESITIKLLADGEVIETVSVSEGDKWAWSFTDLPQFKAGEEIEYTIAEEEVEGYTTEVDGYNVINTHTPEVIEIDVTKVWEDADNQDGIRPDSITINLLADGEEVDSATVTAENEWTYTFENLPKYAAGEEIVYTVEEVAVDGYESNVNGYIITNTHTPAVVEATVVKVWDDAENQDGKRPQELTVTLSNGTNVTLNPENNWTATVENLPKFAAGVEIAYSWTEGTMPEGYELSNTSVNGTVTTLTNSYTPEETEATVIKVWDDEEDQDGKRPESLTVTLSDGIEVTLNEENKWTATVENLPKYEAGEIIEYTWTEGDMPEGYELTDTSVDGTVTTLTNSYTPEETEATVIKVWDDAEDQDGKRPESLTVTLSDGTAVVLNEENEWTATVENLPKYEAGEIIEYTWTEEDVAEYELATTEVEGTVTTLTNKHEPEMINIEGTKVWEDEDNKHGFRPESITINLYKEVPEELPVMLAAEPELVKSITVTEADKWAFVFENLPKYEDGVEIVYSITEDDVNGYSTEIEEGENGYIVTNTINEFILNVNKKWIGNTGSEVEVQILRGSEVLETVKLNAKNEWKAETTIYGSMEAINVKEVKVPSNYHVSYSNISSADENGQYNVTVTNTYIEEDPDEPGERFTVKKIWVDDNKAVRPESIKVQLYKNGKAYGRAVTLSEKNNWRYVWTDLPDSNKINWTVKETVVPVGYVASIEEVRDNYHYIYNTYKPVKENVNTGA